MGSRPGAKRRRDFSEFLISSLIVVEGGGHVGEGAGGGQRA
jgi:hypothetical protein